MKIVYVIGTLATQGGTAKMVIEKANMYATHLGYDVTIITLVQLNKDLNTFKLSDKIKQINLEIPLFSQYKYNYPKRLWVRYSVNRFIDRRNHYGRIKK